MTEGAVTTTDTPRVAFGIDVGPAVCAALGLDGELVTKLSLAITANEIVTVTIERCVAEDEAADLVTLLDRYALVELEEEGISPDDVVG